MTLILTWLFPFGICMGSDSAVSYNSYVTEPSGRKRMRILTGGTKTLWIPKIKAGISYWGEGNIGSATTDVWLSDFIFSHRDHTATSVILQPCFKVNLENLFQR